MSMYGAFPKNADGTEKKARPRTSFEGDKGLTVQADREQADINKIVARFEKTGTVDKLMMREPFYGDVSEYGDLADCIMKVKKAEEQFMLYPAEVRERFDNDPVKFVAFFEDENNLKEAVELGLALPRPVEPAQPANPPA